MTDAILTFLVICLALLAILLLCAPEGYEDEQGFHYGRRK